MSPAAETPTVGTAERLDPEQAWTLFHVERGHPQIAVIGQSPFDHRLELCVGEIYLPGCASGGKRARPQAALQARPTNCWNGRSAAVLLPVQTA